MPTFTTAKELREKRASIAKEMLGLVETASREERSLSQEEREKFNRMEKDEQSLLERAEDIEKVEAINGSLGIRDRDPDEYLADRSARGRSSDGKPTRRDVNLAWRAWGKKRSKRTSEDHEAAERVGFDLDSQEMSMKLWANAPTVRKGPNGFEMQQRATTTQTSTLSTLGGALVQNEAIRTFEEVLLAYGGMRPLATVIRTETGGNLPWPKVDDTGSKGNIIDENSAADTLSVGMNSKTLGAFKYTSNFVKVSMELLQDSFMDWDTYLMRQLATRIARIQSDHFTFGATLLATPEGVTTKEATYMDGVTCRDVGSLVLSSTSNPIISEYLSVVNALDPAYAANASWMFHYKTLGVIKAMVDANGRPIWNPGDAGFAAGNQPTISGYPYNINQSCKTLPAATTGPGSTLLVNRRIAGLGDWSKYIIRDVREIIITRADERFIEFGQSGFIAFSRATGAPIGSTVAATCPMKWMVTKATTG